MTTLNIKNSVVMATLPKIYVENMELGKYTRYRILVPHNNVNIKLTGVDVEQARPHKLQTRMPSEAPQI